MHCHPERAFCAKDLCSSSVIPVASVVKVCFGSVEIGVDPRRYDLISLVQLGTIDYATGLQLQQQLVALRKEEKIGDVLLLLEHKPVITLGRNAKAGNVVASSELLAQRGVELFDCDRGGDVTFHGPGQIVGYPIFDLRAHRRPMANARP